MNNAAKKQLEPVTLGQIKEILTKNSLSQFDKMIIAGDQPVKRCNYVYVKFKYQTVERALKKLNFPLYAPIKEHFAALRATEASFADKALVPSPALFDGLAREYQLNGEAMDAASVKHAFQFPFEVTGDELVPQQSRYFFPPLTQQQACSTCNGRRYVTCTNEECGGRHKYKCPKCDGDGKIECKTCHKTGFVKCTGCDGKGEYGCSKCNGTGQIKCGGGLLSSGCGGTGYIKKGNVQEKCVKCSGRGQNPCTECHNGIVRCAKCVAKGEVRCTGCNGTGETDCSYCGVTGAVTCKVCYDDKERYGLVDCPTCKATKFICQVVYVESTVISKEHEATLPQGEPLKVVESAVQKHFDKNGTLQLQYKNLNDGALEQYDDLSKGYADTLEKNLLLNKSQFPILTKEEMYYQVVPCVELSYKHILTNEVHEFAIIDIWNNPEIIFYSEAEKLKQSVKNVVKSVGGFLSKLFKTKKFFSKEDKRNEMYLLIYLAKIDNRIAPEEKVFLSDEISDFGDLTNSEKQRLFDLMNATTLPELTKANVTFSSKERAQEVLDTLHELANVDREMAPSETALIEKIKGMM
jgi:hypothetical protein